MVKCPFCSFENEDGALFCEQCKSDLSGVAPAPSAPPPPPVEEPIPMAMEDEPIPMAMPEEDVPTAAIFEATPIEDAPVDAPMVEAIPLVEEGAPVQGEAPPPPPMPPPPVPATGAVPVPPPPTPVESAPAAAAPAAAAPAGKAIPPGSEPKLHVIRGAKPGAEFPLFAGQNFIGRSDERPVDIDLEDQEPPDRVWTSRQHAVLEWDADTGTLTLEDLNSSNGTYLNRGRVFPGSKQNLGLGDVIQIGTIHLKVKV